MKTKITKIILTILITFSSFQKTFGMQNNPFTSIVNIPKNRFLITLDQMFENLNRQRNIDTQTIAQFVDALCLLIQSRSQNIKNLKCNRRLCKNLFDPLATKIYAIDPQLKTLNHKIRTLGNTIKLHARRIDYEDFQIFFPHFNQHFLQPPIPLNYNERHERPDFDENKRNNRVQLVHRLLHQIKDLKIEKNIITQLSQQDYEKLIMLLAIKKQKLINELKNIKQTDKAFREKMNELMQSI